jgi:hypothetical protein
MSSNTTGSFDIAVGGDLGALNSTIASVFGTIHDAILPHTFNVNVLNIASVSIDITQPPVLSFAAPQQFRDEALKWASANVADEQQSAMVESLLQGSITVSCASARAVINLSDGGAPITVSPSVTFGAAVFANPNPSGSGWVLQVQLSDAVFNVNDLTFSQVLDEIVGPALVTYLNNGVLAAIAVPSISLPGATLAAPILSQEQGNGGDDYIVAYSGMNAVTTPDPGTDWPTGTVFVAVDANVLNTVANSVLPAPSGNWEGDPFKASYSVQLGAQIELTAGSGNQVSGTLTVSGSASACFITPNGLPNICAGGSISGSVGVSAAISAAPDANNNQVISVQFLGVNNPDVSLEIDLVGIPIPLPVGPIIDAIVELISSAVSGLTVNVYTLDPISLSSIGLRGYSLGLQNLQLATNAGPGGLPMAMVTGKIGVIQTGTASASMKQAESCDALAA